MTSSAFPRRSLLLGAGATAALTLLPTGPAHAQTAGAERPFGVTNPLIARRADPHVWRHADDRYYFTATVPEYDRIVLRTATTIAGLATAAERVIWTRPPSGPMGGYIWAPEIHHIDGRWYVHFTAGDADDVFRVRPYVLQADGADPMTSRWTVRGRISTFADTFSLDATTFTVGGVRYLSWAQQEPGIATNSNLYIARMSDPSTLTGPQVRIAVPTAEWETRGYAVNEAPSVVVRNGRVFMTFSASATDANYCLGLLTAAEGADLLSAASWTKSPGPVLTSNDATGQYGPGHSCFTTAPDGYGGQADLLVHHARDYRDIVGDPLNDPNRATRVQRVQWNADGTPDFGVPVPAGPLPVQLQSVNFPDRRVRHAWYRARLDTRDRLGADASFRIVTGLAGGVSLESTNFPGRYLRAITGGVDLARPDGSTAFARAASFRRRPGLSDTAAVSFESVAAPGSYLRHRDFVVHVEPVGGAQGPADATFRLT